jgi:choline dehydrogenase-like flavoprotein
MEILKRPEPWPAIVIGSGATGSVAAAILARNGIDTLILEAGPDRNPKTDLRPGFEYSSKSKFRHYLSRSQRIQEQHPGYWDCNPDLFVNDRQLPYSTPPGRPFRWIRGRQPGGRTLTWGGACLRFSDYEFKAASRDGFGPDWPCSHEELAPFYSEIERTIRVTGANCGLPQLPDGDFLPPIELTALEKRFTESITSRWPERKFVPYRGISIEPTGGSWPARSMQASYLGTALSSGKAVLRPNSAVTRLLFDQNTSRARAVEIIDTVTKSVYEIPARAVILCASTIETIRLMLLSESPAHPAGLGNSGGLVGKFVMDHPTVMRMVNFDGISSSRQSFDPGLKGIWVPRFQNLGSRDRSYLRGFGVIGSLDRFDLPPKAKQGIGDSAVGYLYAQGEGLPIETNRVSIDRAATDCYGIPIPLIDVRWGDNDLAMAADMATTLDEMIEHAGGKSRDLSAFFSLPSFKPFLKNFVGAEGNPADVSVPGLFVHEMGGARMGSDPLTSVVDPLNRCWDCENVLVLDMACFPTGGWQNPTLTAMAIAARGASKLIDRFKTGEP